MNKTIPIITIDGPSGVGKGSLSLLLANNLKWNLLDSGAIYRVLALSVSKNEIEFENETAIAQHATKFDLQFKTTNDGVKVILDDEDVTAEIRTQQISEFASQIAKFNLVRDALLEKQRSFKLFPGLVADGRDMGTTVFPDAKIKIFLEASAEIRAKRRLLQLQEVNNHDKFEKILAEIKKRDDRDRNRQFAPLVPASDAVIIDTSAMTIKEVLNQTLKLIKSNNF